MYNCWNGNETLIEKMICRWPLWLTWVERVLYVASAVLLVVAIPLLYLLVLRSISGWWISDVVTNQPSRTLFPIVISLFVLLAGSGIILSLVRMRMQRRPVHYGALMKRAPLWILIVSGVGAIGAGVGLVGCAFFYNDTWPRTHDIFAMVGLFGAVVVALGFGLLDVLLTYPPWRILSGMALTASSLFTIGVFFVTSPQGRVFMVGEMLVVFSSILFLVSVAVTSHHGRKFCKGSAVFYGKSHQ